MKNICVYCGSGSQVAQVADTDVTVMIERENGTGKELIARALHDAGDRGAGPFVAANVGALPESLVEGELFGYEVGAFGVAVRQIRNVIQRLVVTVEGPTVHVDDSPRADDVPTSTTPSPRPSAPPSSPHRPVATSIASGRRASSGSASAPSITS